jgi:probable rRNA maturation factor
MPFTVRELKRLLRAMLRRAKRDGAACELALVDDADMEKLHAQSLGHAGPTNILAFPEHGVSPHGDEALPLGSLALSVDSLHRECFLYGQDKEEHCIRLLAHGLAHLLGHDHGPAMNAVAEDLEAAALEELLSLREKIRPASS